MTEASQVLPLSALGPAPIRALLGRYGLCLELVSPEGPIPGSFWGAPEAGLRGDSVFAAANTPVHSILHEACHYICMDSERRARLDTDAGGDFAEEDAVCYLQILLADTLDGVGAPRLMADMDRWGYTFRLGSARSWFQEDAEDARQWLCRHGLISAGGKPTYRLRETESSLITT